MKIKIKNKTFEAKKVSEFGKFSGLMFTRRKNAHALVFEFEKPTKLAIHSCFVFFPFVAVWSDENNKIIDFSTIKPFRLGISPEKPFCRLIEIPINEKYSEIVQALVGGKDLNI